ncbi:hypothetical protein [Thiohalorhabdus sp.]|uniref:hypothetical protein n=1 Tax=Thiohalorhabdus sp. TaxID=3094134 RepID=UPI002FC2806D
MPTELPNPRDFARQEIDAGRARSCTGVANQASQLALTTGKRGERVQDWIQQAVDEAMRYLADKDGRIRLM